MSTRNRESHSFGFVLFLLLPCRIAKMCSSDSKWMRMSGLICRVEVGFNYWRHPYSTRSPCCAKDIDTLWEYLMCHFFLQTLTFTIRWTYCCPMYVIKATRWYDNSWAPIIKGGIPNNWVKQPTAPSSPSIGMHTHRLSVLVLINHCHKKPNPTWNPMSQVLQFTKLKLNIWKYK